jgi:hypothetical protein
MREILIQPGVAPDFVRALICGLPSSGKTHMAATAERPLFLSDAAEGGYKTIPAMDPELWWDPKVPPKVWAIEKMTDMPESVARLETMAREKRLPWKTIVIDPLSIYVDRYLSEQMALGIHKDPRQYYGDLMNHLRSLILRLHALPADVLWLCHVKNDGAETNGPAIGGQMGGKFPAFCDFKWLTVAAPPQPNQAPTYELRTRPYRSWTFLGSRWLMPDPLLPSMKCVAQILGRPQVPVSPAVPGYPEGVTYNWQRYGAPPPAATSAA